MVKERVPPEKVSYEYASVEAAKEIDLQKKIDEAGSRRIVPMTMITLGKHVIVTRAGPWVDRDS